MVNSLTPKIMGCKNAGFKTPIFPKATSFQEAGPLYTLQYRHPPQRRLVLSTTGLSPSENLPDNDGPVVFSNPFSENFPSVYRALYETNLTDAATNLIDAATNLTDAATNLTDAARFLIDAARFLIDAARFLTDAARFLIDAASDKANAVTIAHAAKFCA